MTNDPIYLLKPVFNSLDTLIWDQGDRLYIVFFYVCLFVIGWVLSGGLRRGVARHAQGTVTTIIVIRPPALQPPPLPPLIGDALWREDFSADDESDDGFAA